MLFTSTKARLEIARHSRIECGNGILPTARRNVHVMKKSSAGWFSAWYFCLPRVVMMDKTRRLAADHLLSEGAGIVCIHPETSTQFPSFPRVGF